MAKQFKLELEAREALATGVKKVAQMVGVTLGPKGRNVILEQEWGNPIVTKDGVTVAKNIELSDTYENLGAKLCTEAASKTNDVAGDGTTTATVLASALVSEGLKYVSIGGSSASVVSGMNKATAQISDALKTKAEKIEGLEQISAVASISGNSLKVGETVASALDRIGKDGVITLEESRTNETEVDVVSGLQFDRGYVSHYFINSSEAAEVVFDNPVIFVTDYTLDNVPGVMPLLEKMALRKQPMVLIAPDFNQDILQLLIFNRVRGGLPVVAIKAPAFGNRQTSMLEDIAVFIGGEMFSKELGSAIADAPTSAFGSVEKIIVTGTHTTLMRGAGDQDKIEARADELKAQAERIDSTYDKEKLLERVGKLVGGVAVIRVGAATEAAVKELKYRYEDSISATRAALELGVVPGGGTALLRLSRDLDFSVAESDDERRGMQIVQAACEAPLRTIINNGGIAKPDIVIADVLDNPDWKVGYNANTNVIEDLTESGVIDPAKVTINALENAVSIAVLILNTEGLVTIIPKAEKDVTMG